MTYKIKNTKVKEKKDREKIAYFRLTRAYRYLNDEAQEVYGTDFDKLSIQEQDEIIKKKKDFIIR